ncbi:PepSY-associated TM helix domain-containing protein [Phenylobacterium deserti]|uniref:Peptidase n=1 Tax=Phenylobacterium deserti TaxID=1914756 RepID=A0A328AQQ4_9CAUL|nr:PepSY-associated TM helix domain-containing protein [Phenylobacterium deserti]RAK57352.1 hypothetical protein DJ018_05270 [Phenylobacterium deserti]
MSASQATAVKPPADEARAAAKRKAQRRAAFLRQMVQWHWISAAICLIGMLLFAVTGFTLNHAAAIQAQPKTEHRQAVLPQPALQALAAAEAAKGALPEPVRAWAADALDAKIPAKAAVEWNDGEAYVALPRPGGDGWISIDTATGDAEAEFTSRGWIAYLNDLHKGRNSGPAWSLFIDVFAAGCVVFCVTGLVLLQMHSHARKLTWPMVGLGLIVPLLLALFLIH